MNISRLSALEDVREIREYLRINVHSPDLKSFSFLKNLRVIKNFKK